MSPKVDWPTLNDEDDGQSIGRFFKDLEDIFSFAAGGKGMGYAERLVCLKTCLEGTRKMVYENVIKAHEDDGLKESRPDLVYKEIKDALMRFSETVMERTVRVRNEWKQFSKVRGMSALEFETKFIKLTAQLERIGFALSEKEKHMSYLEKVGMPISETIRMDRRQRPDRSGGTTERLAETWEEAHAVLVEVEAVKAGSRMLVDPPNTSAPQNRAGGRGRGSPAPFACHNMRDRGACKFGDECKFSHDPKVVEAAKDPAKRADGRAKKLCKYIKNPSLGECPDGNKCPFAHDPEKVKRGGDMGKLYKCDHCEAMFKDKDKCVEHEKVCPHNPSRACPASQSEGDNWNMPVGLSPAYGYGIQSFVVGEGKPWPKSGSQTCAVVGRGGSDLPGWGADLQRAEENAQLKAKLAAAEYQVVMLQLQLMTRNGQINTGPREPEPIRVQGVWELIGDTLERAPCVQPAVFAVRNGMAYIDPASADRKFETPSFDVQVEGNRCGWSVAMSRKERRRLKKRQEWRSHRLRGDCSAPVSSHMYYV